MAFDEITTKKVYTNGSEGKATASISNAAMTIEQTEVPAKRISNVDVTYRYESNEVVSNTDIISGHIYKLDEFNTDDLELFDSFDFTLRILSCSTFTHQNDGPLIDEIFIEDYESKNSNCIDIFISFNKTVDTHPWIRSCYCSNSYGYIGIVDAFEKVEITNMVFMILSSEEVEQFLNAVTPIYGLPKQTNYNEIESVTIEYDDGTSEIIR